MQTGLKKLEKEPREVRRQQSSAKRQAGGLARKLDTHPANQQSEFVVFNRELLDHYVKQGIQNQASKVEVLAELNNEDLM